MRRLDSLQAGRAIAVASVIVYHLTGLSLEYQHGCFYAPWTQILRAGVDIFFVISGVVMVVTTHHRLEQQGIAKRFLVHRVSRIYPPYLFLTVIVTMFWIMRPKSVNSNSGGVSLFSSYTLWPSVNQLPLVQVGWTLSFEMMFYLVFFLIISFTTKAGLTRALACWAFIVVAGWSIIALNSSGSLVSVFPRAPFLFSPYVLEFVAGCLLGLALLKRKIRGGRAGATLGLLLFFIEAATFQFVSVDGALNVMQKVLLFLPPSVFLIYGLIAMEAEKGDLHVPRWVVRCGDMSYSIYLVHLLTIHFAYRYLWRFFDQHVPRSIFMIGTTGLLLAASIMFYKIVEIPFSRWSRIRLEALFKVS